MRKKTKSGEATVTVDRTSIITGEKDKLVLKKKSFPPQYIEEPTARVTVEGKYSMLLGDDWFAFGFGADIPCENNKEARYAAWMMIREECWEMLTKERRIVLNELKKEGELKNLTAENSEWSDLK